MTRYLLGIAVGLVFLVWLIFILPGWVLGMMYAGQVMLVPDAPMDADFWAFVAAMYLPPVLAGVTVYWLVKTKRKSRKAGRSLG